MANPKWIEAKLIEIKVFQDIYKDEAFEGYYMGSRSDKLENREVILHRFFDGNKPVEFWGFSQMDLKLKGVPVGSLCQLSYLGKEKQNDKSKNEVHQVKILYTFEKQISKEKIQELNKEYSN